MKNKKLLVATSCAVLFFALVVIVGYYINSFKKNPATGMKTASAEAKVENVTTTVARIASGYEPSTKGFHRVVGTVEFLQLCKSGSAEEVADAVRSGTNVNVSDRFGMTALMLAVKDNTPDVVEILVNAGARVNERITLLLFTGTPLFLAVESKYSEEMVKILLRGGANVNAQDPEASYYS